MNAEFLVVGLGNPGPRYLFSPHNAGFEVADRLRELARGPEFEPRGRGLISECRWRGASFLLLKPQTFMNLSGEAVAPWLARLDLPVERLLVAYDDLDLPFGTVRLRGSGGAGGHHGMESIVGTLGSGAFPRIRIGVGDPEVPKHAQVDYLLKPLPAERWEILAGAALRGVKAILDALSLGVPKAMSIHNAKAAEEEPGP